MTLKSHITSSIVLNGTVTGIGEILGMRNGSYKLYIERIGCRRFDVLIEVKLSLTLGRSFDIPFHLHLPMDIFIKVIQKSDHLLLDQQVTGCSLR